MQVESTLLYLTGNRFKFEVAQHAMAGTGIQLEQNRLTLPEIQSNSVQEIAEFSARWAAAHVDRPFVVTDSAFFIDALNGFPGAFIKFINQWFSTEDLLRLMHDKPYRHVTVYDCLVYVRPGEPLVSFCGSYQGKLANQPGPSTGTPIERLFVPSGYETPISEFSHGDKIGYWSNSEIWRAFRRHLASLAESTPDQSSLPQ
jgi:XTP/dITP diphosphohydrolase